MRPGARSADLLWSRVSREPRVRVHNHTRVIDLIVRDDRCVGARFLDGAREKECEAAAVLLATGGAGQVFSETTNPAIATGDGIPVAWRAGARVADLEFVQFHPTALSVPGAPRFLLSEALRGEGAWLINSDGERFMTRYERAGELASRDLVSRAIVKEAARTGTRDFLIMQHLDADWVHQRFPTIAAACHMAGLDLAQDPIPVGPAAHYMMGGVETDIVGAQQLPGLFAAGEVACAGVHGANRLASNSLLEGLVFGARAAQAMVQPPVPGAMHNVTVVTTAGSRHHCRGRSSDRRNDGSGTNSGVDVERCRPGSRGQTPRRPRCSNSQSWSAPIVDLALLGYLIATRRAATRGVARRPLSRGLPGKRRSTLEDSRCRRPESAV